MPTIQKNLLLIIDLEERKKKPPKRKKAGHSMQTKYAKVNKINYQLFSSTCF